MPFKVAIPVANLVYIVQFCCPLLLLNKFFRAVISGRRTHVRRIVEVHRLAVLEDIVGRLAVESIEELCARQAHQAADFPPNVHQFNLM